MEPAFFASHPIGLGLSPKGSCFSELLNLGLTKICLLFLQVKNILYHAVKEMVRALKIHESEMEDMDEN